MLLLQPTRLLSQMSQLYQKFQLKMIKGTFLKRKGHNSSLQVSKRHANRKKASHTTKSELHTRFSHFSIQEEQKLIDKDTTAMWLSKKEREKHVQCMPVYWRTKYRSLRNVQSALNILSWTRIGLIHYLLSGNPCLSWQMLQQAHVGAQQATHPCSST